MTDLLTEVLAIAALASAAGAIAAALFQWFQLQSAKDQIKEDKSKVVALGKLVDEGQSRIESLGKLVKALDGMLATQEAQLSLLEKQVNIATDAVKVQEAELAVRREMEEWTKKGPIAKAEAWVARWLEEQKAKKHP